MSDFFDTEHHGRKIDITGIENAILDLLVQVKDYLIDDLGLDKGTMRLVDTEQQGQILDTIGELKPEITPGGSCANVLRSAASLGARTCYSSAIADDVFGEAFERGLERHGVKDQLVRLLGATGTSVILVTPDGERTMNTHLGVCRDYNANCVPSDDIRESRIFFTTGYIWDTPNQIDAIEQAIATAREANCRIAIDLADPFAVSRSKEHLERHARRGLDLVFANAEEALMMTEWAGAEACRALAETVRIAVVKDGANGAFIGSGGELIHIPSRTVKVVDTTGAGDCFAAGFLYGLVRDQPLDRCGEIANLLGSDTIQQLGVRLSPDIADQVHAIL